MIDLENAMDELELMERRLLWMQSDIASHVQNLKDALDLFNATKKKADDKLFRLKNYIQ